MQRENHSNTRPFPNRVHTSSLGTGLRNLKFAIFPKIRNPSAANHSNTRPFPNQVLRDQIYQYQSLLFPLLSLLPIRSLCPRRLHPSRSQCPRRPHPSRSQCPHRPHPSRSFKSVSTHLHQIISMRNIRS